ncbi:hypothetical protein [Facilibium subflavum]|uniref:hypothetical protein n=1 Tax=Facilibium subflavum TaxID=2219058 RepID=UPI000E65DB0F|nr:hypothetical protein [Facilibium subflavum]
MTDDKKSEQTEKTKLQAGNKPKQRYPQQGRYRFVIFLSLLLGLCALGVAAFVFLQQKDQTEQLSSLINQLKVQQQEDQSVVGLGGKLQKLERLTQAQSNQIEGQLKTLNKLVKQNKSLKQYIDTQIAGVNANQAQNDQRLAQIQQNYLQPTQELTKQIQLMHKQTAISYLQLASVTWQFLHDKQKTLFFLDNAHAAIVKVKGAQSWLEHLSELQSIVQNSPDNASLLTTMQSLSEKLGSLQLKQPLKTKQSVEDMPDGNTASALFKDSWQKMKSLVSIHKVTDEDIILTDQAMRLKVKGLVSLAFYQLKMAALNDLPEYFKQTKLQLEALITKYYAADHAQQKWLETIKGLQLPLYASANERIKKLENQILTGGELPNRGQA